MSQESVPKPSKPLSHFLRRHRFAQLAETAAGVGTAIVVPHQAAIFAGMFLAVDGILRMMSYDGKGFFGKMLGR